MKEKKKYIKYKENGKIRLCANVKLTLAIFLLFPILPFIALLDLIFGRGKYINEKEYHQIKLKELEVKFTKEEKTE